MFFSKQKSIVGVDIGSSYIKVAQITHGSEAILDTYGIVNIANRIDLNNNEAAVEQSAAILKNLLSQARVNTKKCVASLPNGAVFTSVVDVPVMTDSELESAMPFEAKKYIPLPFSEVALSWSVVAKNEQAKMYKVLLIAVPNQVRESYLQVFEQAGLELEIIEIEALALIRALVFGSEENNVIIDIGGKTTGLNVIKNGLLQMTRNLNIGGDTVTEKMAQSLNITKLRAEQFKRDFGITKDSFIPEAVKPVLNTIKAEVKQLISIYQSQEVVIKNIFIVGGGANMPGMVEFFSDAGISVQLGNPLARLRYSQSAAPLVERFKLQLPVAIGLALRSEN